MTPREIAARVAKVGRLSVIPDDLPGKAILLIAGMGLIRWDTETEGKRPAWVLTDAGHAAVGDIKPSRSNRKAKA